MTDYNETMFLVSVPDEDILFDMWDIEPGDYKKLDEMCTRHGRLLNNYFKMSSTMSEANNYGIISKMREIDNDLKTPMIFSRQTVKSKVLKQFIPAEIELKDTRMYNTMYYEDGVPLGYFVRVVEPDGCFVGETAMHVYGTVDGWRTRALLTDELKEDTYSDIELINRLREMRKAK